MSTPDNSKFVAKVEHFVEISEARMVAVQQEATKRTIEIAQRPVAKGGRMRVDTGFLRNSGQASLTGMPSGPSRPTNDVQHYDDGSEVSSNTLVTIAQMKLGGTIWFGWRAFYARYREAKDAFLRMAVQRWPQTVAEVVEELKRRIK